MKKHTLSCAVAVLTLLSAQSQASSGPHWGYVGETGPAHWGELDPKFSICAAGLNQSPIDIASTIEAELAPLAIAYASAGNEILNNGHTVQVNVMPGSTLSVDGKAFELKQFHFHTPSENTIDGKPFALEVHLVHADAEGHLAVIGVMFEEGGANPTIEALWQTMPQEAGAKQPLTTPADPATLLPEGRDYYRFNGSLTTPPCTEGVRWLVMKTPLTVSKAQVETFAAAVHGANNRPVQNVNARPVLR